MSNIPNPFRKDNKQNFSSPTPPQSSSPGFLAITRPASASSIGHDGRGRSMGRANFRSNYSRQSTPYSNNSNNYLSGQQNMNFNRNKFSYNRGHQNSSYNNAYQNSSYNNAYQNSSYNNAYQNSSYNHGHQNSSQNDSRNQNLSYHSPSKNFFQKQNNFPNSFSQSTPKHFHGFRKDKSGFNRKSFNNSNQGSFHKTPLKDIPVDKFISINMIKDPWEDLDSDTDFDLGLDSSESKLNSFQDGMIIDTNPDDISLEGNECVSGVTTSSQKDSSGVLDGTSDSIIIIPTLASSSEKDTGTESDS